MQPRCSVYTTCIPHATSLFIPGPSTWVVRVFPVFPNELGAQVHLGCPGSPNSRTEGPGMSSLSPPNVFDWLPERATSVRNSSSSAECCANVVRTVSAAETPVNSSVGPQRGALHRQSVKP